MSKWLHEVYNYNLGVYVGLVEVGLPTPVTSDCKRSLDKVRYIAGRLTRERWYIIPNDAMLSEG